MPPMLVIITFLLSAWSVPGVGLKIPESDDGIADSISNVLPVPYTAAEFAVPPAREIQKGGFFF